MCRFPRSLRALLDAGRTVNGGLASILLLTCVLASPAFSAQTPPRHSEQITGVGATLPYPVYFRWGARYHKKTGLKVNFQAMGSGAGIRQIEAGTVDYGASDAPLKPEKLSKHDLIQFPMILSGIVPVVNMPGVGAGDLRLDGQTFADIYLGKIRTWDDPRIQKLNPGIKLPHRDITVVHRADGSGTTWIFTSYLSRVSRDWARKVGHAKAVDWPAGVGGKGNQGVASYVSRIRYSIGYVEYAYAMQNAMTWAMLKNRAGYFVAPSGASFQSAASHADWAHARGFYMVLTHQPGANSWPITGASFILMHKQQADAATARRALRYFNWAYANGGDIARQLDYVPMPRDVVRRVEQAWHRQIRGPQGQPIRGVSTSIPEVTSEGTSGHHPDTRSGQPGQHDSLP